MHQAARRTGIAAALALAALALFWPAQGHAFLNWDDDQYVTRNPAVAEGLTAQSLTWACTTSHAANWHPLTWISHMIDVEAYGLDPRGHHRTNLLLHALNAALLFLALARLANREARSALVAALFAVHPLHVESVAWIAERKDVLSTAFLFLALLAWAGYARRPTAPRYLGAAAAMALGLAAKPTLVTLPALLLVLDFWPLGRGATQRWTRLAAEKLPLCALSAASALLTLWAQRAGGALGELEQYPLAVRAANAALALVTYPAKALWPRPLAAFYPHTGTAALSWPAAAAMLLIVLITVAAIRARSARPYLLAGWLFYLVSLAPMLGLIQVGEQALADRYTYVPLTGIFIAVTWAAADSLAERPRAVRAASAAAALIALVALSLLTRRQIDTWKDSVTLFRHAIAVTTDNATAQLNLAMALTDAGDLATALPHYKEALRLRPGWAKAHSNLGVALERAGDEAGALASFRQALRLDPANVDAYCNLGSRLAARGQTDAALAAYLAALRVDPDSARAHYEAGSLYAHRRRWDDAVTHLRRAVEVEPRNGAAHWNLALALYYGGRVGEARAEMEEARRRGYRPPPETERLLPEPLRRTP